MVWNEEGLGQGLVTVAVGADVCAKDGQLLPLAVALGASC